MNTNNNSHLIKHKPSSTLFVPSQELSIEDKKEILLHESEKKKFDIERTQSLYEEVVRRKKNSPIPKIHLLKSEILVRSVPPIINTSVSGLIIDGLDGTAAELNRIKNSTENVSDFQEVLLVGNHLTSQDNNIIKPGDFVKINFKQYHGITPGSQDGQVRTQYNIPMFRINGEDYILIDFYDVMFVQKREDVDPKYL